MTEIYIFNKHVKEVRNLDLESTSICNKCSVLCSAMTFTSPII